MGNVNQEYELDLLMVRLALEDDLEFHSGQVADLTKRVEENKTLQEIHRGRMATLKTLPESLWPYAVIDHKSNRLLLKMPGMKPVWRHFNEFGTVENQGRFNGNNWYWADDSGTHNHPDLNVALRGAIQAYISDVATGTTPAANDQTLPDDYREWGDE